MLIQQIINNQQDEKVKRAVEGSRSLLARCRYLGVERAFAEGSGMGYPRELEGVILQMQQLEAFRQRDPSVVRNLIEGYEHILQNPLDEYPALRASVQSNLGDIYRGLSWGNHAENLAQAIKYYIDALEYSSPEIAPSEYARIKNNVGLAYRNLPKGIYGNNLRNAIACYEEALRFYKPDMFPLEYAMVQNNMGVAYQAMPTGDLGSNLKHSIQCFQEALRFYTAQAAPMKYASAQNNLGNVYRELPTGDRRENVAMAIQCYQEALRYRTPRSAPLDYAMTQNNLGLAYSDMPITAEDNFLYQAIDCYREALQYRNRESSPREYADTLNNLGLAYTKLRTGDRSLNLTHAIQNFQEALEIRTPVTSPRDYAQTQNNLGNAFTHLKTGDLEANLESAIHCYQEALRFRTFDADPRGYAATQIGLGNNYLKTKMGDRKRTIACALDCFKQALRVFTPDTNPFEYANALNGLGQAYLKDIDATNEHVLNAIQCFRDALHYKSLDGDPLGYAAIQTNMGLAYLLLSSDRQKNVKEAIECFDEALQIYSPEKTPLEYADVQNNLGNAYQCVLTENYQENLQKAIACYQEALRFQTPENNPHSNRKSNRNLALLFFKQREWDLALSAYHKAVLAGERIYREGLIEESKEIEVAENVLLYRNAAFSAAQLGYLTEALLILEKGKTRLLAESLILLTSQPDKEIDLLSIQALIPDEQTALVTFCITSQGSLGIVVLKSSEEAVRTVGLERANEDDLRRWVIGQDIDGNPTGEWMEAYLGRNTARWHETMERVLRKVGLRLIAPTIGILPAAIKKLIILPSGGLSLLPLHAAPLSEGGLELVCDRFEVSYAPSVEVLSTLSKKASKTASCNIYGVINPQEDSRLAFTKKEGAAIASLFPEFLIHEGRNATKQAVVEGVKGHAYLHFSCHGEYKWDDPPASGLALADENLTLADFQSGKVDLTAARLVVLSACETGLTDIFKGSPDEYVGLPAGFMLAGSPCVLSSLWSVSDLSSALLMERFYNNHLKKGMSFAAALRDAQFWVRNLKAGEVASYSRQCYQEAIGSRDDIELLRYKNFYNNLAEKDPNKCPFEHPYYWSAFSVYGM